MDPFTIFVIALNALCALGNLGLFFFYRPGGNVAWWRLALSGVGFALVIALLAVNL